MTIFGFRGRSRNPISIWWTPLSKVERSLRQELGNLLAAKFPNLHCAAFSVDDLTDNSNAQAPALGRRRVGTDAHLLRSATPTQVRVMVLGAWDTLTEVARKYLHPLVGVLYVFHPRPVHAYRRHEPSAAGGNVLTGSAR